MIHPDTELKFINTEIGWGVFATKIIPAGTIVWVLDKLDREFSVQEYANLGQVYRNILDAYTFRNNQGNYVLCWDNGRFLNHSFQSNCLTTAYDFELSIKEILPGEELTKDYGYSNVSEPFRGKNEGTKRKIVYPDDLLKYYKIWDKKLLKVFPQLVKCEQPLSNLISIQLLEELHLVSGGTKQMKSIASNYYYK